VKQGSWTSIILVGCSNQYCRHSSRTPVHTSKSANFLWRMLLSFRFSMALEVQCSILDPARSLFIECANVTSCSTPHRGQEWDCDQHLILHGWRYACGVTQKIAGIYLSRQHFPAILHITGKSASIRIVGPRPRICFYFAF
jgi:hypothetical protein